MCASTIEGDVSTPVDLVIVIVASDFEKTLNGKMGVDENVSEHVLRAGMAHECEGFGERTRQWGRMEELRAGGGWQWIGMHIRGRRDVRE